MPNFIYSAKKDSQHTVNGQIAANNVEEAIDLIHQLGLVPVSVQLATDAGAVIVEVKPSAIKAKDIALMSRQLASLLKSGVPLLKALDVIAFQTKHRFLSTIIGDLAVGVKSGRSFSQCLSDYPMVFGALYVAMIRAGEESGKLKQMLLSLAVYLQKQEDFSGKVRQAMVYPGVMLTVGLATVIFILSFVMPKVTVIFINSNQQLPWPTQVVITLSHWLKIIGLPLLIVTSAVVLIINRWRKTLQGAKVVTQLLLSTPILKDFLLKADLARFTRTFQVLLESGLSIVRGIEVATPTVKFPLLRTQLLNAVEQINGGESLGQALTNITFFDPMMIGQIAVAEESGNLVEALSDLADHYEEEVESTTKAMTVLIEPIMIVGIGSIIGFIVFAMLMPIFSMDIMAR